MTFNVKYLKCQFNWDGKYTFQDMIALNFNYKIKLYALALQKPFSDLKSANYCLAIIGWLWYEELWTFEEGFIG